MNMITNILFFVYGTSVVFSALTLFLVLIVCTSKNIRLAKIFTLTFNCFLPVVNLLLVHNMGKI